MQSIKAVLQNNVGANGLHKILIRITADRKNSYITTDLQVKKNDFNIDKGDVRKTCRDYRLINSSIEQIVLKIKEYFLTNSVNEKLVSIDSLKRYLKGNNSNNFIEYAQSHYEHIEKTKSVGYAKHLKTTITKLKRFAPGDITFQQLNLNFIRDFEEFLKNLGNDTNTIASNHSKIKTVINYAIKEGLTNYNPYNQYKIKKKESDKSKLTIDEIKRIETINLPINSPVWNARNIFLFSYYFAGIRIGDVLKLQWKQIDENRLIYRMNKNGKEQNLKILDPAKNILNLYDFATKQPDDLIFKIVKTPLERNDKYSVNNYISSTTAYINSNLKILAVLCNIKKNISTHIARHSFANLAKDKISIYELSNLLNHSSVVTTQIYVNSLSNEQKDSAIDKIFG